MRTDRTDVAFPSRMRSMHFVQLEPYYTFLFFALCRERTSRFCINFEEANLAPASNKIQNRNLLLTT